MQNVYSKRQLRHVTPIMRVYSALKTFSKNPTSIEEPLPLEMLKTFNELVAQEITMFFTALRINGKLYYDFYFA